MAYLEHYLINNCYKSITIIFGIFYVYFINFKDNTKNIDFSNTTEYYNNSTNIIICENILKSTYLYKIYSGILLSIILISLVIFNFILLHVRKYFCTLSLILILSQIFVGLCLTLYQVRFNCFNISFKYYKYQQITYMINYIGLTIILHIIFYLNYLSNLVNYRELNNINRNNINTTNINSLSILDNNRDRELPKYTEVDIDPPPTYNSNA